MRSEYNKVFGGYVEEAMQDCGAYLEDKEAFIFSLDNQTLFRPKNPEFSLFLGGDYIFCFGNNILVANNCDKNQESMCKFPEDYICDVKLDEDKSCYLTGGVNF